MRRVLMTALVGSAFAAVPMAPAQAALVLVGTFSGNQCNGGPISTCFANGTLAGAGTLTQVGANGDPVPGSPGILRAEADGDSGSQGGLTWSLNGELLSFTYTPPPEAHWLGLFQGGSGLNCDECNNTYQLFYSSDSITSVTDFDLSTYFDNPGLSHIDLFDTGSPRGGVPEPATWAMMLVGFAGIGMSLRRRKAKPALMQIA